MDVTLFFSFTLPQIRNHFFFSPIFNNVIAIIVTIFSSISAMVLPQLVCHKFFFPISTMPLPQSVCHKFFFSYFGNAIATISLSQIFFFLYFGNAIVTISLSQNFFFLYFSNAIATISLSQFFFPISAMLLPQLVCHKFFFFTIFRQCYCYN